MELRQLPAAAARSVALNFIWTSFSASANVEAETAGPTAGAVPNAGGAPGGRSTGVCAWLRRATAAPRRPRDVRLKNCLRDLNMASPNHIVGDRRSPETLPSLPCEKSA